MALILETDSAHAFGTKEIQMIIIALIGIFNKEAFDIITKTQMLYFSFSTITTLGYGDIVPNSGLAKMLANLEAITGQMYTTIFIARLVGLQIVSEVSKK